MAIDPSAFPRDRALRNCLNSEMNNLFQHQPVINAVRSVLSTKKSGLWKTLCNLCQGSSVEIGEIAREMKPVELRDLSSYYDHPCKFRLRSGKEIYGVVWESTVPSGSDKCYFASSGEYGKIKMAETKHDFETSKRLRLAVDPGDFVYVERISIF